MAHQYYRTKGFVLAKKNSGEADQIFTLYTQNFGKIEVVGKSIRKITSKLKAGIDVFYFIEAEFIQGKRQKILTDAILLEKFFNIRKFPEAFFVFSQMSEAVSRLIPAEKIDEAVWNLLLETIKKINDLSFKKLKLEILCHYFLWNFFSLLGYSPELYSCPICSSKLLPETFFLSPHHGGVICWGCCSKERKENQSLPAFEIEVGTVKLVRFLIKEPIEKAGRLNIWEKDLQNLNKAFDMYFSFLTESCGS